MLVILATLVIIASTVAVRLSAMKRSREFATFKIELRTLASFARNRAIESGDTVALGYMKADNALIAMREGADGQEQRVGSLTIPEGITVGRFLADQRESPEDGWRVPFFPDGSSAGGGMEFEVAGDTLSLAIPRADGRPRVARGPLPDLSFETWSAGSYERRE